MRNNLFYLMDKEQVEKKYASFKGVRQSHKKFTSPEFTQLLESHIPPGTKAATDKPTRKQPVLAKPQNFNKEAQDAAKQDALEGGLPGLTAQVGEELEEIELNQTQEGNDGLLPGEDPGILEAVLKAPKKKSWKIGAANRVTNRLNKSKSHMKLHRHLKTYGNEGPDSFNPFASRKFFAPNESKIEKNLKRKKFDDINAFFIEKYWMFDHPDLANNVSREECNQRLVRRVPAMTKRELLKKLCK